MPIVFQIIYIILCILMARRDSIRIKNGKRIYHAINGTIHLAVIIIGCCLFGWTWIVPLMCLARVAFDVSLNLYRGNVGIDYVSPNPKSIVDKVEKLIFGMDGFTPKILYIVILIVFNIVLL